MTLNDLKNNIEETKRRVGPIQAMHCFANYLVANGHHGAGNLLVELKEEAQAWIEDREFKIAINCRTR